MPRIIAVSNQKGGVGKTTTAINLAAAVARAGYRVLLADLDPQGNATSGLGFVKDELEKGVFELLTEECTLPEVVLKTSVEGLDLAPATAALIGAEVELMGRRGRERRLETALGGTDAGEYHFIFLDCPPSLGFLTVNAFTASDSVLIPVQAEYLALEGLGQLLRTLSEVRRSLNPRLVREGEVVTMFDRRNRLCHDVDNQLREVFGAEVFETVIPRNVRLGEAPSYGQSIFSYSGRSSGAKAYEDLAAELLTRRGLSLKAPVEVAS
ncbi:MAG: ParA family protein [Alphaproteobacteria bacterium]|nr:ParA family protein [Alphaproteobacteria bacterium]